MALKTLTLKPNKSTRASYVVIDADLTLYVGKGVDVEEDRIESVTEAAKGVGFEVEVGDVEVEPSEAQKYADAHDGEQLKTEAASLNVATTGTKLDVATRILEAKAAAGGNGE